MTNWRIISLSLALVTAMSAGTSSAHAFDDGDAVAGEKVFKRCMSCHMVGEDATNKVGPVLNAVFGRAAGSVEDYKYGKDLAAAGAAGLVWTDKEMFEYLEDTRQFLRGKLDNKKARSKMSFKLKKEQDRADVIAYLKTFSPMADEPAETNESAEGATTN